MNTDQIVSQITTALKQNLKPAELEAPELLQQLLKLNGQQALTVELVMKLGPQIERAMAIAERLSEQSRRTKERCQQIPAVPHPGIPLGY